MRHLLLVADTPQLGPLLAHMTEAVAAKIAVTLAIGGSRASTLYPLSTLPPIVEVQAATLDGSLGQRGSITTLLPPLLRWADVVCAVGTPGLYRSLKSLANEVRLPTERNFLYALFSGGAMACGLGACLSCVIETETGFKPACLEGPVFDLATVEV
jgi:dihydroorotate dehydrogenase electron transfer subunit